MINESKSKDKRNSHNKVLKCLVSYISKKQLNLRGIKHRISIFGVEALEGWQDQLFLQQQFSANGQMKILKNGHIDFKVITFMNKSNEFIVVNNKTISILEFNISLNWSLQQIILVYEKENILNSSTYYSENDNIYCLELSTNDNLIVTSRLNKISFLEKKSQENWVCCQTLRIFCETILDIQLNEQGNILIAHNVMDENQKLIILIRNDIDGLWRIIKEIIIDCDPHFCFLGVQNFALQHSGHDLVTFWKVSSTTLEANKFQELKLQLSEKKSLFNEIRFFKSKGLLLVKCNQFINLIKQQKNDLFCIQQVETLSEEFEYSICRNEAFLIYYEREGGFSNYKKVQIGRICED